MKLLQIAALACFAVLPGCLIDRAANGDGVRVDQPDDIPVPRGMKLKDHLHQSHTLVNGDYRYADLVYEGPVAPLQVAAFLAERLPQHSFREVHREDKSADHKVLVFQRGRQTAECTVDRGEFTTRLEIRVRTHPNTP